MPQPRTGLLGVPLVMAQNVIYAAPGRNPVYMAVFPPSAVIEASDTNDASTFEPMTVNADGSCYCNSAFVRCTSVGGCTAMWKVY